MPPSDQNVHLTLEDNSTSTLRGKQINLHQNYPADCCRNRFHFSANCARLRRLWQQIGAECITPFFVKLNPFLSPGEEALYVTFQPHCQPLRQPVHWLVSSGGALAFDGGCLVLIGTQSARIGLIPGICFLCVRF